MLVRHQSKNFNVYGVLLCIYEDERVFIYCAIALKRSKEREREVYIHVIWAKRV